VGIDNGNTGVALEQIVVVREHIEVPAALAVLFVLAALAADNSVLDTAAELACNAEELACNAEELADTADILGIVGLAEEGLEDIAEELVCNADILGIEDTAEELACNAEELADTADILDIAGLADTDDIQEE
jgi:hypothetical protein